MKVYINLGVSGWIDDSWRLDISDLRYVRETRHGGMYAFPEIYYGNIKLYKYDNKGGDRD